MNNNRLASMEQMMLAERDSTYLNSEVQMWLLGAAPDEDEFPMGMRNMLIEATLMLDSQNCVPKEYFGIRDIRRLIKAKDEGFMVDLGDHYRVHPYFGFVDPERENLWEFDEIGIKPFIKAGFFKWQKKFHKEMKKAGFKRPPCAENEALPTEVLIHMMLNKAND